jgi:hypothetical protein
MAARKKGKANVVAVAKQLIAGADKHLANGTNIMVLGASLTPTQVTAKLQALVNLLSDVDAAKAAAKAKLATEKIDIQPLRLFLDAFEPFVMAAFGNAPDVLADFGLHPKARAPLTVEAKAAAVAKRIATRTARHTMGSRQKKGIKGAVTGITVTPITPSDASTPQTV